MTNAFATSFDGADPQAVAVQAYLTAFAEGIQASYKDGYFEAGVQIHRWHNGREQGYVVQMVVPFASKQINIAFFEHRNSDQIHAVMFEALTYGDPATLSHVPDGQYESKRDTTFHVDFGEAAKMAEWIIEQLEDFWVQNHVFPDVDKT